MKSIHWLENKYELIHIVFFLQVRIWMILTLSCQSWTVACVTSSFQFWLIFHFKLNGSNMTICSPTDNFNPHRTTSICHHLTYLAVAVLLPYPKFLRYQRGSIFSFYGMIPRHHPNIYSFCLTYWCIEEGFFCKLLLVLNHFPLVFVLIQLSDKKRPVRRCEKLHVCGLRNAFACSLSHLLGYLSRMYNISWRFRETFLHWCFMSVVNVN